MACGKDVHMAQGALQLTYADFGRDHPEAVAALLALGKATDASGIEKSLTELVKLRVSQINGCGFCVDLHFRDAMACGVSPRKLNSVIT